MIGFRRLSISIAGAVLFVGSAGGVATGHAATDGSGLQTAVATDIVGHAGGAVPGTPNRLDIRSAEVLFFSPVDHLFNGQLNLAAHYESGESIFEVHEAFIGSSRLIPRSRFRVGQFFLGIGRLNQFHQHDWPFVSAPKVQQEFFGDEGVLDTGAEFSWLTPLPFYLDLTAGLTNGWTFGHSHDEGKLPLVPTHYARATTFFELGETGGVQIGLNYLGRKAHNTIKTTLLGLDLTAKWREARIVRWLIQSEVWHRSTSAQSGDTTREVGAYLFPMYGLSPSVYGGIRLDAFSNTNAKALGSDQKLTNGTYAVVPTLTYKASEFSTLRVAFTQQWSRQVFETEFQSQQALELQAAFILGAHPAHEF